jgi:hypothetical protein
MPIGQNKEIAMIKVGDAVLVRAYSGVFFGYLVEKRATEVDLKNARHIYSWDSVGLSRKALCVEDLAILGAGMGTRISGPVSQTLSDWKNIVAATPEAAKVIEALPCKP